MSELIKWLHEATIDDIDSIGGKNASLGEMIRELRSEGVKVPGGFATTAKAFRLFLSENHLIERIEQRLSQLDITDVDQLAKTGAEIRDWISVGKIPRQLEDRIRDAFQLLTLENGDEASYAVRSSATAEDLPEASFAGQQETFLNVNGIYDLLDKIRLVFASLYNDRAIAYRVHQGFKHADVSLSAGVQLMIRSDLASSGVLFTLDTESGFDDVVFVTAAYGLGETVVQGQVNPDEFYLYKPNILADVPAILKRTLGSKAIKMVFSEKPGKLVETVTVAESEQKTFCLTDKEVELLARYAISIEKHYRRPMDIEWAKDGRSGELYIVQARPETVQSQKQQFVERYELQQRSTLLAEGRSVGQKIGTGVARVIPSVTEMNRVQQGDVLVTDMTDPDWEPVMKLASAIVTNRGGRTCHAAIIARELGIPCVVGCMNATDTIADNAPVTVSCAEGDTGFVYSGILHYEVNNTAVDNMPQLPVKLMLNVGNPERAFIFASLPNAGVGLARMEFIINNMIGIHPRALLEQRKLAPELSDRIKHMTSAYASPRDYFIQRVIEGVATIAAAFNPKPVIFRLSDFKSNEYAHLVGGTEYEPVEENPMIGFRGASRYVSSTFSESFRLECEAIRYVRDEMQLTNVDIMIPFVRTVEEAEQVIELLADNRLKRGENGLRIVMMCELPVNALMAEEFLALFDGFSIGSNDLTQTTLGLDRDSALVANSFDEQNPAVLRLMSMAIKACKKQNKYIGICGQGPSDHPELADWLMKHSIDSISLNPDTIIKTWLKLANS